METKSEKQKAIDEETVINELEAEEGIENSNDEYIPKEFFDINDVTGHEIW